MKGSKRVLFMILSIMLVLSLVVGCGLQRSTSDGEVVQEDSIDMANFGIERSDEETEVPSELEPDKVITTISLYFETVEFEKSNEGLNKIIAKYKAYVENSNISHNQYYNEKSFRHGSFTVRVPKESINDFKNELSGIGNMTSESTDKEDVTKQYKDTESRLKVITTKEERILSLLEKAEKVEDIIALENQLSKTIEEKELLKTSLLAIDDKVDFTTIYIDIQEVEKLSDTETMETGFATRIKNALGNSLFKFKKAIEDFIIASIYFLPFALVFILLAFLGYRIFIKINKKNTINDKKDKS